MITGRCSLADVNQHEVPHAPGPCPPTGTSALGAHERVVMIDTICALSANLRQLLLRALTQPRPGRLRADEHTPLSIYEDV